jgi:ATP-dependent Lhr-like helicase
MLTKGQQIIRQWYQQKNREQFAFQQEMEHAYLNGFSGLLNAPTGTAVKHLRCSCLFSRFHQ